MEFNGQLVSGVLLVWVILLTAWVLYRELQFRRFFKQLKENDVRKMLDGVLTNLDRNNSIVNQFSQVIEQIRKKDLRHVQRLGLIRFNPFRDSGGNQSFALALLNEENTGIVLTGLHARETTRVYVKDIQRGVSKHELSKEEREAVELAIRK